MSYENYQNKTQRLKAPAPQSYLIGPVKDSSSYGFFNFLGDADMWPGLRPTVLIQTFQSR